MLSITQMITPPARRRRRLLLSLFLVALALFSSCGNQNSTTTSNNIANDTAKGTRLPHTALPMPPVSAAHGNNKATMPTHTRTQGWTLLDGQRAYPSDYEGKVLVLDFWATYCPPCREEVPHLIALQRRYGAQGLNVVGLNVGGDEDRPKVPEFVQQFGIQYPLGYPDPEMSDTVFATNDAIPQTFVFDRHGKLLKHLIGYDGQAKAELEQAVQTAISE